MRENNKRLTISVSPKLHEKIMAYCDKTGVSVSSLGALSMAQFLESRELVNDKLEDLLKSFAEKSE